MSSRAEEPQVARLALVLAGSFAISAALCLRLAFDEVRYLLGAGAFGLLALATLRGARRRVGPWLALALLNLLLVVPELGLRSAGFRHVSGIQFGYPTPQEFWEFEADPELFWKLPLEPGVTNSLGFFGPEPRVPKPAGELRMLVLGDSCSQQGYPQAWPELAAAELSRTKAIDEINLALSGYSSHQGLVVARRHAKELAPDLAVVFFGWNDHWLARGAVDADKKVELRFEGLYRRFRVLQLVRRCSEALGLAASDAPLLSSNRVPLESYRANLEALVTTLRDAGAKVVLTTAPSTHDLAVPSYLVEKHFVASADVEVPQHRAYNDVVREVARQSGALLFDLEHELASRPDRRELFLEDGIHFSDLGRARVAQLFAEFARRSELVH